MQPLLQEGRAADMLLNYETVKLFTAESFELRRYGSAIDAFQSQEKLQLAAISVLNILQGTVVFAGLSAGGPRGPPLPARVSCPSAGQGRPTLRQRLVCSAVIRAC